MSSLAHNQDVPYHLGIVPDGNRRWARANGLTAFEGHRRGVDVTRDIAIAAYERGVKVLTFYAFSTENWQRTQEEVGYLMELFFRVIVTEYKELEARNVRFRFVGRRDRLSAKMIKAIDDTEARTAHLSEGMFVLCLNYGGQQEIADAAAALITAGVAAQDVTPERFAQALYAPDVPPVDLIIRTSGEQRLSGFMLWRSSYAELLFVDQHWPAFTAGDLDAALAEFAVRQRRFGN
ncbi:di-trans,poly-cis-decaprenylcistransferase [Candidatus Saccharibacteria bacterium]|nr:di-trans,poly-cis-decaprenylcistransferase [Candidatus Saccharibacteria bacterium]